MRMLCLQTEFILKPRIQLIIMVQSMRHTFFPLRTLVTNRKSKKIHLKWSKDIFIKIHKRIYLPFWHFDYCCLPWRSIRIKQCHTFSRSLASWEAVRHRLNYILMCERLEEWLKKSLIKGWGPLKKKLFENFLFYFMWTDVIY